jgi:hypothetical protein
MDAMTRPLLAASVALMALLASSQAHAAGEAANRTNAGPAGAASSLNRSATAPATPTRALPSASTPAQPQVPRAGAGAPAASSAAPSSNPASPATTTTLPTLSRPPALTGAPLANNRPAAARSSGGHVSILAIVIAALGALLVLGCAAWALARRRAFEPHWWLTTRHSLSEASYRMSVTWAEFTDWARLGH